MKTFALVFLIVFIVQTSAFCQWVQTNGPYGKTHVLTITSTDSLILTSTECGFFSKNAFNTPWSLNSTISFSAYTQIGDSLFINDEGIKLIDLSNPDNPPININPISVSTLAHSDSCLYGGHFTSGFSKSSDFGTTWSYYNNGLPVDTTYIPFPPYYYVNFSTITSIDVTTNYIFCGTSKGIYRNASNLGAWSASNSGLPIANVKLIKSYNDTLFCVIGNDLFQSNNYGNNWTILFSSTTPITSFLKVNNHYYTGTVGNGVFHSSNKGATWNMFNAGLTDSHVTTISYYDSTLFCGTYTKGVFSFNNSQWLLNRNGMICSNIASMTCLDSFIVASTWDNVFISDLSNNWNVISPTYPHSFWASVFSSKDTIVLSVEHDIASWPYELPYLLFSSDKGLSWDSLITQPPFKGDDPYGIYYFSKRIFAAEDEKMYYTDDLGLTWTNISLPPQFCNNFNGFTIFNSIPFASACGNSQLLKLSSNNWILSNNGLPSNREPKGIAFCDGALFTYVSIHGMFVSLDTGKTWSYASNGLLTQHGFRGFASYNSHLFVTTENGVFATRDFGQNWIAINAGLKNLNTNAIKILNDTLYVGTDKNGIWKQAISKIDLSISQHAIFHTSIKVFPNPFNSQTTIQTTMPLKNASLRIDNCYGSTVALVKNINGYTILFNRDNLPTGLYLFQLSQDNKIIATEKLIIVDR